MAHQGHLFYRMQPSIHPHPDHRPCHLQTNGCLLQSMSRGGKKLGGHREANPTNDRPPLTRPLFPRSNPPSFCSSISPKVPPGFPPRPSPTVVPRPPPTLTPHTSSKQHAHPDTIQHTSSPSQPSSDKTPTPNKGLDHASKILGKSISLPTATPDPTVKNRGRYHRTHDSSVKPQNPARQLLTGQGAITPPHQQPIAHQRTTNVQTNQGHHHT